MTGEAGGKLKQYVSQKPRKGSMCMRRAIRGTEK